MYSHVVVIVRFLERNVLQRVLHVSLLILMHFELWILTPGAVLGEHIV